MNHKAIRALYSNVVTIRNNEAFDAQENQVEIDMLAINAWVDPEAYKAKRQAEYPNLIDYIDGIVKGDQEQIAKYIADCQAVKTKYPKS
jgi:hypothetical protein